MRNAQGDIIKLIDSTGTVVVEYTYDAYGNLLTTSDTSGVSLGVNNPFRYRGYYYDVETGLYYLNSRYYNPHWGRFVNADSYGGSTGKLLSHNIFAYCSNNPVMMSDPSGKKFEFTGNIIQRIQVLIAVIKLCSKPSGRTLLKAIADSDKTCTIKVVSSGGSGEEPSNWDNAVNGKGTNVSVFYGPKSDNTKVLTLDPTKNTGNETVAPNYIVLSHELVHAYRDMNGISVDYSLTESYSYIDGRGTLQSDIAVLDELYTVGILPHEGTIVTENMLRADFGLQQWIKY